MSKISQLKDLSQLPTLIEEFSVDLDEKVLMERLEIQGKTLEQANKENPSWYLFYEHKKSELKILLEYMKAEVSRVRGKLFKQYTERSNIALTDRAKDKYIDAEPAYLTINEVLLEVQELYDKYTDVVRAFETRGYALNNITKARTMDVHNVLL